MSSLKKPKRGSKFADGPRIREARLRLGLTQLELAMQLDCSERLVRKMEKSEGVSLRKLSLLCVFLRSKDVEVALDDLVFTPNNAPEVAKQWFRGRFLDQKKEADKKWFSDEISLSQNCLSNLKVLERLASATEISLGAVLSLHHNVSLSFHLARPKGGAEDPSGTVLLSVENEKITRLHVFLDRDLDLDQF